MSQHDYTTRADWEDAAARYIIDHSDADAQFAKETARELADMHDSEFGNDVADWPHPSSSAHEEMTDWAQDNALCDEDEDHADE